MNTLKDKRQGTETDGKFNKIKTLTGRIDGFRLKNFGNTSKAAYLITMLLIALTAGFTFMDSGLPKVLSFIIAAVLGLAAANIALLVIYLLLKFLLRNGIVYITCLATVSAELTGLIYTSCGGKADILPAACVSVLCVWLLFTFVRSAWALLINRVRTRTVMVSMTASGIAAAAVCLLLFTGTPGKTHIGEHLKVNNSFIKTTDIEGFENELSEGKYTVETLYYGALKNAAGKTVLESDEINLSSYVGGYKGIQRVYRRLYQDYDIYTVPLTGKVYYPLETDNCPVVFIVHGNHNLTSASYEGYDYLGEYLASHGYVVVSADSNFCNGSIFGGLSGDNDGRAVLLLNNIEQVLKYNKDKSLPLYGKIDEDNIAVAGHSRGGEAAVLAVLFSRLDRYPTDGSVRFFWDDINIRSVIAIAPTVNQYKPSDHEVELKDVNYLLIQGVNDQDVSSFMGARTYENISFSGEGSYLKSSLYIAGANHGQFNTKWGRFDMGAPVYTLLNTADFISDEEQQNILKIFSKVFLDTTLKGKTAYSGLLKNCSGYLQYLPETLYAQVFEESGGVSLCDFEEEADLTCEDGGCIKLEVIGADKWTEELSDYSNPSSGGGEKGSYILKIDWIKGQRPKLNIDFETLNLINKELRFDIANADTEDIELTSNEALQAEITLIDTSDNKATAELCDYAVIYSPLGVYQGKVQSLIGEPDYKVLFQTVSIPVSAFEDTGGEGFDAGSVTEIEITFHEADGGSVNLDNIGFADS